MMYLVLKTRYKDLCLHGIFGLCLSIFLKETCPFKYSILSVRVSIKPSNKGILRRTRGNTISYLMRQKRLPWVCWMCLHTQTKLGWTWGSLKLIWLVFLCYPWWVFVQLYKPLADVCFCCGHHQCKSWQVVQVNRGLELVKCPPGA